MKIVMPGGSGQVGELLCRAFERDGHDVVVLSRGAASTRAGVRTMNWDGRSPGEWVREIDGSDVVVNLCGHSVNCRYNAFNRQEILRSRVESTQVVGEAIGAAKNPPAVWLQAGTATIYAHRYDEPNDEETGIIGGSEEGVPETWKFSVDVAKAWEAVVDAAHVPGTRKVKLRTAMVMSPDRGGVFDVLLGLVRRWLGGRSGDGRQYVSWIHHRDFVRAVDWLIRNESIGGAVNVSSPEPLPNSAFMRALREAWGTRIGLPAEPWMLELGAIVLRTETELVLKSRRVVPGVMRERGFRFEHPHWPDAARDLCEQWRRRSG